METLDRRQCGVRRATARIRKPPEQLRNPEVIICSVGVIIHAPVATRRKLRAAECPLHWQRSFTGQRGLTFE